MSDQLADSAERLFGGHIDKALLREAETGRFPQALWDEVTAAGFTAALLPEEAGGFGATVTEAMRILQISASFNAPLPLAETMLAGWLLAKAGLSVPEGVLTLAPVRKADVLSLTQDGGGWRLSGTAQRVPWARDATGIVVLATGPEGAMLASVPAAGRMASQDVNLAGEPRDTVRFDMALPAEAVAPAPMTPEALRGAGAALRTVQIAGALSRVLSVTVAYVQTRVQFGRPISKFQAIQHNLAIMAGQSAAAIAAADMATDALDEGLRTGKLPLLTVAAAKARAGEAASLATGLAHQSHGAIGFTQEYELHYATRRLWSWRDEFGNEAEWNGMVGRAALRAGAEGLWPLLTDAA
ncbi:MAG: acyl-CoA dehydrogenase family protein [Janthinobacterium lividum]